MPDADAIQRGFEAYEATDYDLAIELWTPLADAGSADAQVRLGNLYSLDLHDPFGPGYKFDHLFTEQESGTDAV